MNEVTKLYEKANIKAKEYCDRDSDACMNCCPEWKNRQNCWKYKSVIPPFTAEKQIILMAFLINRKVGLSFKAEQGEITVEAISRGLAGIVNRIWQDLTEEERKQIKEILE